MEAGAHSAVAASGQRPSTAPSSGEQSVGSEAGRQVRALLDSAEQVAAALREGAERDAAVHREEADTRLREAEIESQRIIDAARRQADSLLAERRRLLEDLSDAIAARAGSLLEPLDRAAAARRELDDVLRALADAADRLAKSEPAGTDSHASVGDRGRAEPSREPDPAARASRGEDDGGRASPDAAPGADSPVDDSGGARLVAAQMAAAGSSRGEVAGHLQRTFELADLHTILDDVFGDAGRVDASPERG